ncbi:hypothetical protein EKO04_008671 [Ascochyta lentis]|uniref:Uncharacterized protein n=1 Tax=Ascochyta lentis TaxID=205686 RepID=A0A8H7IYD4_9PLEO|nr:hypothetical protein EKO04_008671 [Ascochyta lentis]
MPASRHSDYENWNDRAHGVNDGDLMNYINRELQSRDIYLPDTDIRQFLGELKNLSVSGTSYELGGAREDQFVNMMKSRLTKDLDSNGSQGLHRSRSRFLTFCFVARRLSSNELARALLRFFVRGENKILGEEESFLLTEWCLGLQQLEGLVSEDRLNDAFRRVASLGPPMFEEWRRPGPHHSWITDLLRFLNETFRHDHDHDHDRDRDRHQMVACRELPPRRLSVPHPRRPFMIDMPPYPRTGYNSPMISPMISHGVTSLHLQQQVHAFELDRLRRDIDDMRYR